MSVPTEEYRQRLERALSWLDAHFSEELNIDQLADLACFSRYHFQRVFTGFVGEPSGAYLRRLRLETARKWISEQPGRSLTDIAFSCGFTSSTLFSRYFKKEFHCSPRAIKKVAALTQREARQRFAAELPMPPYLQDGVRVEVRGTTRLVYIRCTDYGPSIGLAYGKLFRTLAKAGLLTKATRAIGLSFDDPHITDRKKCRYYAGVTLEPSQLAPPGFSTLELEGGKFGAVIFSGKLAQIDSAIAWLYSTWLPGSGFLPGESPLQQIILKRPLQGNSNYEIELCLPLQN